MINFSWIREKLLSSKKYWPILEEIIIATSNDLETDIDLQLKGERIFEILGQIILDICTHIIAHSKEPPPQTYYDCMKKLGILDVITTQTAEKTISLVKMRNIVVHQYDNINYHLLFDALGELHKDFPQFQEEILTWIDSQENNEKKNSNSN